MTTIEPTQTNGTSHASAIVPIASGSNDDVGSRAISAFASEGNFIAAQRMAKALSQSSLMPSAYQNNIPNCLIAMEMASRIGASVLMVAQSLDIIHGRPSWRSQFLIATVNASGRFTPLRFRFVGKEGTDDWGCRAWAKDKETGEECMGPLVTIAMAKAEGWYTKNGSKWRTLPELLLMYRSGAFWTRVYCPEIGLGMSTSEEVIDTTGYTVQEVATPAPVVGSVQDLEARILAQSPPAPVADAPPAEDSQRGTTVEPTPDPPKRTRKAAPEQEVLVQDEPGADG